MVTLAAPSFATTRPAARLALTFQVLDIIAQLRNVGAKEAIMYDSFDRSPNLVTERSQERFRRALANSYLDGLFIARHMFAGSEIAGDGRILYGMEEEELLKVLPVILHHQPIDDLASLFQAIGETLGQRVMGVRWTAHHRYAPMFLRHPQAYWLEIVRNPYSRYSSEKRSHGGYLENVFRQMADSSAFIESFSHPRHKVVRYEDLCNDTDETLREISEWLGEAIENRPLNNPAGRPFDANSSGKIEAGKDIFDQSGKLPRIGALDADRWKDDLSPYEIALINTLVNFGGRWERTNVPFRARLQAAATIARLGATLRLKEIIRGMMRRSGYTIHRIPPEFSL